MSGTILNHFTPHILKKNLSLNLKLARSAKLAGHQVPKPTCLCYSQGLVFVVVVLLIGFLLFPFLFLLDFSRLGFSV